MALLMSTSSARRVGSEFGHRRQTGNHEKSFLLLVPIPTAEAHNSKVVVIMMLRA